MPKVKLPENIKKLKEQLETGHNLVDHFLVCGIPPNNCENKDIYDFTNKNYLENFKETLKPTIISKFPSFDNAIDSIDEELVNYCFPDGFEPIFKNAKKIDKKFFSLILDNNLCSAEHPQKYLTCLLFYESLSKYKKLKYTVEGRSYENDPDCIDETELSSTKNMHTNITENILSSNKKTEKNNLTNSIMPNGLSGNNTNNDESLFRSTVVPSINSAKRLSMVPPAAANSIKNIFIPKCICLVSIHPYIKFYQKILESIYEYAQKEQEIPLENIITNLIIELPIPPRGLYKIDYLLIEENISLENYENNKLQLTEISLKRFNQSMSFNTKLETLKHILLGSKILIFSQNLNRICETELAFLYLLFPFKYPFQVSSYLHKDNYNILESISPFIIGINETYTKDFFDNNEITVDGMNIYIIDIDNKDSSLITDEEFPEFPVKYVQNLEKEIKILEQRFHVYGGSNPVKDFNEAYQNLFLEFFSEILKGYGDCLNLDYFKSTDSDKVTSIDTLFRCSKFIKSHSKAEIDFYSKFVDDCQLFADFIYKRMIPRNTQEIIDVLLINETINKIKNKTKFFRQEPTDFLNSNVYKQTNKYVVPKARELTEEQTKILLSKISELRSQSQIINQNKDTKNLKFKYLLFPELNFDIFCNNENVNDYYPPPDYTEEIEALNTDLISKSSLGQSINHTLEMKNYLYLTWLEVWAFTFWYLDKEERPYRFNEMLDMLDKVIHHEMNIFNLLFDVLNQENEHEMILNLYQKLLQLKLNPNTFIYNIISNILDKDQIKEIFDTMKQGAVRSLKLYNYDPTKFKERTYFSQGDNSLVSSKLKFDTTFQCVSCGNKINLAVICQNFEDVRNDILWVPCHECNEYNLPKIKVRFGLKLLKSNINRKNTNDNTIKRSASSETNEIVLHSPYNLKININNAVTTQYGGKLNINNFKSKFSALFWNFIWYCKLHHLDDSIIKPYLKNLEQLKEIEYKNPNNEIFQITYSNELYKKNTVKMYESSTKKTGREVGKKILKVFKNLIALNVISVEVQKVTKDKNKKNVSQFIDYLNKTKTLNITKTIVEKSLKNIKKKDGGLKRAVTKKTTVPQHNFENALMDSEKKQNIVEDVKETKNESEKESKKEKGSDLNKTVSGRKSKVSLADDIPNTRERKNSGNTLGKKLKSAFFKKKK